jgi:cell division protein FtsB
VERKSTKSGAGSSRGTATLPVPLEAVRDIAAIWRRRVATIFIGCLAMVMGYGVVFGHNGLTAFAHKRDEAKSLSVQTEQLKQENARLRSHVDRLNSDDPAAIEVEARKDLHYTRAGEVIVTLSPAAKEPAEQKGK